MIVVFAMAALLFLVVALYAVLELRYITGSRRLEMQWKQQVVAPLTHMGSTRRLEVLPLIDWYPARSELRGEAGVSYLIKTDDATVLLDVGLNLHGTDPSPLQENMKKLGVSDQDIDAIVISHKHLDHVGGMRWLRQGTFSPGNAQPDLGGKRLLVPVPMNYPSNPPEVTTRPTILAPGIATTGTISSQLFLGRIDEQALAVNVEGKGIVLIVACGHQTLPKLLARAQQLFREPIHGIIGGLHYPVPRGRISVAGVDLQNLAVFGLTHVPSRAQVQAQTELLARFNPQWISVSAHDSSDDAIELFRRVFGERYHDLRVGEWQRVAVPVPQSDQVGSLQAA